MKRSILMEDSYQFAILVVGVTRSLQQVKKEFVLSKQLLRSGTAIGANIREAQFAHTRSDFSYKMNLALKEANETDYWISLLNDTSYFTDSGSFSTLQSNCRSLIAMVVASVNKLKNRPNIPGKKA